MPGNITEYLFATTWAWLELSELWLFGLKEGELELSVAEKKEFK